MTRAQRRGLGAAALAALLGGAALAAILPPATLHVREFDARDDEVRGSLHVHTRRSDGAGTVEQVAEAARQAGLQFVVFADHGDATRAPDPPRYVSGVLCVDAVEISTTAGHYLALGMGQAPYRLAGEPRDVVADVHRLGGFGIVAHPSSAKPELAWRDWDLPFDGIEWLNADSEWRDEKRLALLRSALTYFFRAPQTIAALFDRPAGLLARWDALNARRRVVGVAGHDVHARVGRAPADDAGESGWLLQLPSYRAAFSAFAVRARLGQPWSGEASRDASSLLAAIRAGRVYTAIDALAAPVSFEFTARGEGRIVQAGDELPVTSEVELEARAPGVPGLSMILLRDGHPVAMGADSLRVGGRTHTARSVYRVEAYLAGRGSVPWILSNPIYVGPPVPTAPATQPVVSVAETLISGATPRAWHIEKDTSSSVRTARGRAPWNDGRALRVGYALGPGGRHGQFGAVVTRIDPPRLAGWDRLRVQLRADRPMRISVQLRAARGGSRWIRSVYVDQSAEWEDVSFEEMRGAEPGSGAVALASVDSLLFVVDTTNTLPTHGGTIWIGEVRLQRLQAFGQVRTVNSR
jgi:hypothetical protein